MEIKIHPNAVFPEDMTQDELDEILEFMQEMADSGQLEMIAEECSDEEIQELREMGVFEEEYTEQ